MLRKYIYCLFIITLVACLGLTAQQPFKKATDTIIAPATEGLVVVGDIVVSGNKKTKAFIVLREIPFRSGEAYSLEELVKKFEQARRQLTNTGLFNSIVVAVKNMEANRVNVIVELKERWYLFPIPYFRPVDRNINQWLVEQKGSLQRVNYGVKLSYNNATGRNDKFRLGLTNGYTKQFSLSYDRLYIDKQLKWGMRFSFATGKNREITYNTVNNKQVFFKDENNYIRNFTNAGIELSYRPAIKARHSFGIGYVNEQVKDTVVALNPAFFKSGRNSISFPAIHYNMTWLDLDYNAYPTKGYAAQLSIGKSGFSNSLNIWQLQVKGLGVWPLSSNFFFSLSTYGGIKLPFKQPYIHRRFLGYGDTFLPGYEYYVIDGVAGGYLKTTFTRELLNFNIKVPTRKKSKEADRIPFRIFAKVYGNTGYVHDPEPGDNTLSNKMLYSGGFGIDILTLYDIAFRLEWTFNSLGENGLFLHRKTIF